MGASLEGGALSWGGIFEFLRAESSILSREIDLFQCELGRGDIFLYYEGVENCFNDSYAFCLYLFYYSR